MADETRLTQGRPLQQFVVLAATNQQRACAAVIEQVLKHPNIFIFGELLGVANVQAVSAQWLFWLSFSSEKHIRYRTLPVVIPFAPVHRFATVAWAGADFSCLVWFAAGKVGRQQEVL